MSKSNKKSRSISDRLQRAKSPAVRIEIMEEWSAEWQLEHDKLMEKLNAAFSANNNERVHSLLSTLDSLTKRRIAGISAITKAYQADTK